MFFVVWLASTFRKKDIAEVFGDLGWPRSDPQHRWLVYGTWKPSC